MRRRVAVKVLARPPSRGSDASLKRFYREARAAAALDHPNIVRAYDIDQDNKLHFLVMEYVDGASLQADHRATRAHGCAAGRHYAQQAAWGLQHAHERRLVHRDIKPANILVDRNGIVKILDMGLALFYDDEDDWSSPENVLGTADYLAPEQAIDSHAVDIRADIYSLGGTLYFLLTGKTPLDKLGIDPALLGQVGFTPRPIRTIRRDVPEALAELIARMMARGPENRYQTPSEVADALTPWTATPIPPPSEKEMPQLSPAARGDENGFGPYPSRSRSIPWTWIGLAAVFLLALLGLLFFLK